jgi:hypothetical protein
VTVTAMACEVGHVHEDSGVVGFSHARKNRVQ